MSDEKRQSLVVYMRNFVFGVEDSLVSTVGLLSGIAAAGAPRASILLTGTVLIFVEAVSMGIGSFLSEDSVPIYVRSRVAKRSWIGGLIMFVSYFISGFIPLLPYLFLAPHTAMWVSIGVALVALFGLGLLSARVSGKSIVKSAFKMFILGGLATIVGVVVGVIFAN